MAGRALLLALFVLGWTGARCELDVDECAPGGVSCGPGECVNLEGSYTCECTPGFCGNNCALRDPCFEPLTADEASANDTMGPCRHGGRCTQRCTDVVAYVCQCVDGWGGHNCTHQAVAAGAEGGGGVPTGVLVGVGLALLGLALLAAALALLAAQARRKRATRGTYSPSGQEYCNPRAEMMHHALKPPPEERLI